MKFSIGLAATQALMPVLVLFAGMSAAGGFPFPVEPVVLTLLGGAAIPFGYEAVRELQDQFD